MTYHWTNLL